MQKTVIIINGNGGVGKDTLCSFAGNTYSVTNVSSITPIKEIAHLHGWNGEKDSKSRKFLSDLKKAFTDYNDLPLQYLVKEYKKFLQSDSQILFIHIREGSEIDRFKCHVTIPCITLLVRRTCSQNWENASDDNVEKYAYDFIYNNDEPLDMAESHFCAFLHNIL